ncbi:hypothetical protein [Paraliobacillus sp. X-1268]|uniref:hypothetical protein n=1 Tax=Paraliobacillus sp. X-1268 TaxID=2213193 RepID=UPI000E3D2111|nr:hypothetical protein [Paraliobacillus sp. X-1268]
MENKQLYFYDRWYDVHEGEYGESHLIDISNNEIKVHITFTNKNQDKVEKALVEFWSREIY